jgi:hypothetical protein
VLNYIVIVPHTPQKNLPLLCTLFSTDQRVPQSSTDWNKMQFGSTAHAVLCVWWHRVPAQCLLLYRSRCSEIARDDAVTCWVLLMTHNYTSHSEVLLDMFNRWSQCPRGLRRVTTATRWLGLRVRIPPRAWRSLSSECCALSGRGHCVGLIAPPEEFYRMWCVLSVILKPRQCRGPGPMRAVEP